MAVLVAAALTMSAAQLFDLATFVTMVERVGSRAEANPIVALVLGSYGLPLVAIAKVAMLALVTAVAAILLRRPATARLAAAVLAFGILVGLVGGISNAIAMGALPRISGLLPH
jgi:hypothetical protein